MLRNYQSLSIVFFFAANTGRENRCQKAESWKGLKGGMLLENAVLLCFCLSYSASWEGGVVRSVHTCAGRFWIKIFGVPVSAQFSVYGCVTEVEPLDGSVLIT